MLTGLSLLLAPGVVFIISLPFSGRLRPGLRTLYRVLGGIIVFPGSGFSYYLASYTGDQGGIAAYFFQMTVISVYVVFSFLLITFNWFLKTRDSGKNED
jgi:uncharacterized membrane protein